MTEVTIDGILYRTGRLTPKQQLHVVRRLAPVLASSTDMLRQAVLAQPQDGQQPADETALLEAFKPFADACAALKDEDVDYVLDTCLRTCQRSQDGGAHWANMMTGTSLMFQDTTMQAMLQLAFATLQENLAGFFQGSRGSSTVAAPAAQASS